MWSSMATRSALPDLLVHELDDHVDRAIGRRRARLAHDEALSLTVEQLEIDDAARLAVGRDEAIEMGSGMRLVLGALQVEHGRQLNLFAPLECLRRGAFGHRVLGPPVRVVARHHFVHQRRIRLTLGLELLRVAVPAERVDDGRGHDHAAHGGVDGGRRRQRQRAVARVEWPHAQQHRLVATTRVAHRAPYVRAAPELSGSRLEPANRVVDVRERGGIWRPGGLPPVEGGHDHPALGQRLVHHLVAETIGATPGTAVELDHDGKRPGALRPVEARELRRAGMTDVLDVLDLDLVAHDGLLAGFGRGPIWADPSLSAANVPQLGPGVKSRATSAMSAACSRPPIASMMAAAGCAPRTEAVY